MKANEPKHTPGPWEIVTQEPGWIDIGKKGTETTSSRVASVPVKARGILNGRYVLDKETAEANARLIAAAPELLEAMTWYAEQTAHCNRHGADGDTARDRLANDVGRRALAAIAKATGKEAGTCPNCGSVHEPGTAGHIRDGLRRDTPREVIDAMKVVEEMHEYEEDEKEAGK